MIQRTQDIIGGTSEAVQRIHHIPLSVKNRASELRTEAIVTVGRGAAPTLPDVYYALIRDGAALLGKKKALKQLEQMVDAARQENSGVFTCRISFAPDADNAIKNAQAQLANEAGKDASLTIVAIALMKMALAAKD